MEVDMKLKSRAFRAGTVEEAMGDATEFLNKGNFTLEGVTGTVFEGWNRDSVSYVSIYVLMVFYKEAPLVCVGCGQPIENCVDPATHYR